MLALQRCTEAATHFLRQKYIPRARVQEMYRAAKLTWNAIVGVYSNRRDQCLRPAGACTLWTLPEFTPPEFRDRAEQSATDECAIVGPNNDLERHGRQNGIAQVGRRCVIRLCDIAMFI